MPKGLYNEHWGKESTCCYALRDTDALVIMLKLHGFIWGGHFNWPKDYMHFGYGESCGAGASGYDPKKAVCK